MDETPNTNQLEGLRCPRHDQPVVGAAIPHYTCGCRIFGPLYRASIAYLARKYQKQNPSASWSA